ncbi:MAG: ABC transporter ATP-binding protein/permease [Lachnospiraceae bacterium]|nr:ABC transporter ATP-binding protein/permease [Lachnospiraceae bacterium]
MKRLLVYLKDYKKESILAPLLKMTEAGFELFVPLVIAQIIDNGINTGNKAVILKMGLLLLLLAAVGLSCSVTAQYFAARAATGFSASLRHGLFKHIEGLSFSELDKAGTSTLIVRMTSDINQTQNGVNMVLRLFLRSPIIVIGAMIMAFTVNFNVALIFVVTIPVLTVVVGLIMKVTIPLYKKVQNKLDDVTLKTRESLTGVRVIRAFNKEEEEVKSYNKEVDELNVMQLFVGRISAFMNPSTFIIVNVATIFVIVSGAVQVNEGIITQGEVVALVSYMSQILVELIKFANLIITVTKAIACANRIGDILELESSMEDGHIDSKFNSGDKSSEAGEKTIGNTESIMSEGNDSSEHSNRKSVSVKSAENICVEFKNVSLKYAQSKEESLTNLSFKARKGETIGIIGGTGSGKTTVVSLIPRFYDATSGEVLVDGINVKEYKLECLRDKIGNVLQKAVLFKGTIRSNLLWGNEDATEEDIIDALKQSQAYEFVAKMEKGIDSEVVQGGKNFSGGQRQRLSIARALVKKPEILILDDSSSALDYATDAKLRAALKELKDTTVFIIAQRTSSIIHADKIIVLEDGEVAGIGNHDTLIKECEVYREIYDSQFDKKRREAM